MEAMVSTGVSFGGLTRWDGGYFLLVVEGCMWIRVLEII